MLGLSEGFIVRNFFEHELLLVILARIDNLSLVVKDQDEQLQACPLVSSLIPSWVFILVIVAGGMKILGVQKAAIKS